MVVQLQKKAFQVRWFLTIESSKMVEKCALLSCFFHMKLLKLCNSRLWLMCGLSAVYHFTFAHTVLWRTLVIGAEFSFWLCLLEVQPRCSVALPHHVLQCCALCNVCVKDLRLCFYWFSSCLLSLMIALMMLMVVLVLLMMIFACLYVTEICHCKNEHLFACVCLFYTFYPHFTYKWSGEKW